MSRHEVEDTTDTDLNVGDSESSEKDNEVDIQSGPTSDISSMQNSNADSFLKEIVPVIILREKEVVTPILTLKEETEDVKPKLDDLPLNQGDARPEPTGGYRPFFGNKIRNKLNAMSIIPAALASDLYCRTHLKKDKIKPARNPIIIKEKRSLQLEVGKKIVFKKIKIGHDYCPVQSGNITGIIESVEGDSTELKIIGGFDEFKEPTGKFSLEDDKEDTPPNKPFKVKFNNWDILNPRFK